ncbi:class I adenylate-forming enzyme family protein [Rhodoligotrophos ferricapiens]|uniref:class I adenylate-forming enzyme family protein n=1 Tax=Rhodoligotrophos ferricapiens TaxID=3069264 RepID=UPI00315CA808
MQTFVDLAERVALRGDHVLSYEGLRFRGTDVVAEAKRLARALLADGVQRGDRVCVWLPNGPEFVLLELATTIIGAIFVPIHSRYGAVELGNILQRAKPVALFYRKSFRDVDFETILEKAHPPVSSSRFGDGKGPVPELRRLVSLDGSRFPAVDDWARFRERAEKTSETALDRAMARVAPSDPAICIFTSGTTGMPKGAMLSHGAILFTEQHVGDILEIAPKERVLYGAPMPSVFGCCNALVASWTHDACFVLMPTFDAGEALKTIQREACNVIYGVPTMFHMLLNHPDFAPARTRSLRSGIVGGAPCPVTLADAIVNRLGVRHLVSGYGMSETCAIMTATRIGDTLEVVTGTVGRPLPDVEIRICGPDAIGALGEEQEGEICVRGRNLMLGYFNGEPELAKPFTEGWFRTGDLGMLRRDGNLRITGRVSDMILVGGFNVYPVEIENLLARHPDVIQAYVVGIEDERLGERPVAFVQARPGAEVDPDELSRFCVENLAKYKLPARFFMVESFPMTPLGKVQKFELKKIAKQAMA